MIASAKLLPTRELPVLLQRREKNNPIDSQNIEHLYSCPVVLSSQCRLQLFFMYTGKNSANWGHTRNGQKELLNEECRKR